jgi:Fe-S cluster biosynthesis and repair protein YggX
MEVMVINELRLNFMDPEAQETLDRHMREFFGLISSDQSDLPGLPALPVEPERPDGG